jgi:hypothetical protein
MGLPHYLRRAEAISGAMAVVAMVASTALIWAIYPLYSDYVRWTEAAAAEVIAASVTLCGDTGTIYIDAGFKSPSALFAAEIEALEFNVDCQGRHCGFYRIRVPDDSGILLRDVDNEVLLQLAAPVAPENCGQLSRNGAAVLSGNLIVRIFLPHAEYVARFSLEGELGNVGSDVQ